MSARSEPTLIRRHAGGLVRRALGGIRGSPDRAPPVDPHVTFSPPRDPRNQGGGRHTSPAEPFCTSQPAMLPVEKVQESVCCKPRGQRLVLSSETPSACDVWARSTAWVSGVATATTNSVTSRNLSTVLRLHRSADLSTLLCGRGRSCGLERSKLHGGPECWPSQPGP